MKITSTVLLFVVIIFQLISCDKRKTTAVTHKTTSKSSPDIPKKDISKTESDDFSFPFDSTLEVKILQEKMFHDDEIDPNLENKTWFGLFKNKEHYTLSETKVFFNRVNDPVIDENEQDKTGWEISAAAKDTCMLLIEKLPYLNNRSISSIKVPTYIYPDDHFKFSFQGIEYTLFATGEKSKETPDSDWIVVSNYKLYLTATINGKPVTELLVAKKTFDDQMIQLFFAGDIDGDSKLDLIIETSNHYNLMSPTIYLSKPAENGKIIKPMGVLISVGC